VLDVILGPDSDLHVGVRGALVDAPPEGVAYHPCQAQHVFVFPEATPCPASPFVSGHWGEFVEFDDAASVVHTSRWPALIRPGWVTDTDDFGYPMLAGRCALNPEFSGAFKRDWSPDFARHIRCRLSNMLAAYAHPSCVAVLVRSLAAASSATRWVLDLDDSPHADAFLKKIELVYPVVRPASPAEIATKWHGSEPFQVVFCGRDFDTKNGALALEVFDRLSHEWPALTFIYIGSIPDGHRERYADLLRRIRHYDNLEREAVLEVLRGANVLFHPSKFESLGMIFLEAASRCVAIVTGSGGGMAHTPGLLGQGALYVNRDRTPEGQEIRQFEAALRVLIAGPARARAMAELNYQASVAGALSIDRRNAVLQRVYAKAAAQRGETLTLGALPCLAGSRLVRLRTQEVWAAHGVMRRSLGVERKRAQI
jgi:glycosyltransferase involved in cell wall biosynthesis